MKIYIVLTLIINCFLIAPTANGMTVNHLPSVAVDGGGCDDEDPDPDPPEV